MHIGLRCGRVGGILSFAATPAPVPAGAPLTLSWVTENADEISLTARVGTVDTILDVSALDPAGDSYVDYPTDKTTYTFTIKSLGRTKSVSQVVEVRTVAVDLQASSLVALPGEAITLAWDVTVMGGGTPMVGFPMSEVAQGTGGDFSDIDISLDPLVQTVFAAGKDNEIVAATFGSGFSFPYQGSTYTGVRVGVNGFLSFDSTIPATGLSSNNSIPNTDTSYRRVHLLRRRRRAAGARTHVLSVRYRPELWR